MKNLKKVYALIVFICFSLLYCGNPSQSIVNNKFNTSGNGGNLNEAGVGGNLEYGISGFFININTDSGIYEAGIGGAYVYELPSDFTPGVFGGYKLGPEILSTGSAGDGGVVDKCDSKILGVVRDFRGNNEVNGHPDFEHFAGKTASEGIVNSILGNDQKPTYSNVAGFVGPFIDPINGQQTTSKDNFDQWYRNFSGINGANVINRQYVIYLYFEPNENILTFQSDAFFPLDNAGFGNGPNNHNFGFTTEIHTKFDYKGGENFQFIGDDDVWVFINNKLAIDLGGLHSKLAKSINLDDEANKLDIKIGNNYNLDFFHAERHTDKSNFRVDTNLSFTNCGTIVEEVPK